MFPTDDMEPTNSSHPDPSPLSAVFRYGSLICGVCLVPVAILGVIGNLLAANVFRRQRQVAASTYSLHAPSSTKESRSAINVLLIALTVVDTVLLVLATPLCSTMAIYNFDPENSAHLLPYIAHMTLFTYPPSMMAQCASVWLMVLISLERWTAICRPLSTRAFGSAGKTKTALFIVIAAAIFYNLCRFGEYKMNSFGNGTDSLLRDNETYITFYMTWAYFALVFALPFLVLLVVHTMIARTIVRARRQRRTIMTMSQHNRREQRTALMMFAVVLAYMCCNTLALLLNGFETLGGGRGDSGSPTTASWLLDSELFSFLADLNNLLIEAHSGLTFIVYFRFSGHFRGFVYYQLRFLCYLRDGTLKTASHRWQQHHYHRGYRPPPFNRPAAETLVERSRDLSFLLAGQRLREHQSINSKFYYGNRSTTTTTATTMTTTMNGRSGSISSVDREKVWNRQPTITNTSTRRLLTVPKQHFLLRNSAYVAVARGSLESHLDPFQI